MMFMDKKGEMTMFSWVVLIVIGVLVLHYMGYVDLSPIWDKVRSSDAVETVTDKVTNTTDDVIDKAKEVVSADNPEGLNTLMENELGIITMKAVEGACNVKGGDWVFEADEVSCTVEAGHGYDCISDENVAAVKGGCVNLGGAFVCDDYYVGCIK
jgi:hypothetical protein